MKLRKSLKHAFAMVMHSRLRSWLTILGIVIGVASVIAIVSIGEGLQSTLQNNLGGLGADLLTISPGFSRGGNFFGPRGGGESGGGSATSKPIVLSRQDVQTLRGVPGILYIETEIRESVNVSYLGKTGKASITGVDPSVWSKVTNIKLQQGRFLDSADQFSVVIEGGLASKFFSQPLGVNQMFNIGGTSFRVVGIVNDSGTAIYMPIQQAYNIMHDKTQNEYDTIIIKVQDANQINDLLTRITTSLQISRHAIGNKQDFSVSNPSAMQATRAAALTSLSNFLIAIAAVSLLVGAVGIANTMFTSVLERTKEIGIMKAIGARNKDILFIFLFNAAFIGLVGGIIGTILGTMLSGILPSLVSGLPLGRGGVPVVSLNSIFMALSVSTIVGVVAGIIPAYQASKLKPVDALRFE
jgi:putative ABC transport system permease protein